MNGTVEKRLNRLGCFVRGKTKLQEGNINAKS